MIPSMGVPLWLGVAWIWAVYKAKPRYIKTISVAVFIRVLHWFYTGFIRVLYGFYVVFMIILSPCNQRAFGMPSHREGYAQKTMLVGIRVSDDEDPKGITNH